MSRAKYAVLILLTVVACGDSTGPATPSATGTWIAIFDEFVFELELTESSLGRVRGSGTVGDGAVSLNVDVVRGLHEHPFIELDLVIVATQDTLIGVGEFTDRDTFTLDEAGSPGPPLIFKRQ